MQILHTRHRYPIFITNRHAEIRSAFLDKDISGIICTIGGIKFTEVLPLLIADEELHDYIRLNPKIVVGSSDMTGLHWFLNTVVGLRTFYGPSAIPELGTADTPGNDASPLAFCIKHLINAISNPKPIGALPRSPSYAPGAPAFFRNPDSLIIQDVAPAPAWKWLRRGNSKVQGRLFGGCLGVMARLNGITAVRPDWRGRIVFLETSFEESKDLPLVQRGLADLIAQGVFEEPAGLVIGRPVGYASEEQLDEYAGVFTALLCEGRFANGGNQFPILMNVDIGHTTPMVTLPYDVLAELDAEQDRFTILESGVVE
jgi:muramoyltetrapeptide carboxypeptidase LdcA involved in peptidoglycan recycling